MVGRADIFCNGAVLSNSFTESKKTEIYFLTIEYGWVHSQVFHWKGYLLSSKCLSPKKECSLSCQVRFHESVEICQYNLACPNLGSNQALYYEKYIDIDVMPIKALQLPFDKDICKATQQHLDDSKYKINHLPKSNHATLSNLQIIAWEISGGSHSGVKGW